MAPPARRDEVCFQIWDLENCTSGLLLNVYRQDTPKVTPFESWQFTPGDIGSN